MLRLRDNCCLYFLYIKFLTKYNKIEYHKINDKANNIVKLENKMFKHMKTKGYNKYIV